jgi:hypothetical protein
MPADPTAHLCVGVVFRYVDATNHWYCCVERDGLQLYIQFVLDEVTVKGFAYITDEVSVTRTLRVLAIGNVIKAYWGNDGLVSNFTDATHNAATKVGIMCYTAGGGYVDLPKDNFKAI